MYQIIISKNDIYKIDDNEYFKFLYSGYEFMNIFVNLKKTHYINFK